MCRPHWLIHDPLQREKLAQILVTHNDLSCHRLVLDVTNTQLNGCRNCRYHQENLVYSLPTSTAKCVLLRYRIYGWIFQDVSKRLFPKKETNNN